MRQLLTLCVTGIGMLAAPLLAVPGLAASGLAGPGLAAPVLAAGVVPGLGATATATGVPGTVAKAAELPVRGVTVSTHRGGREWGDREIMTATYKELVSVGANWVAIHPYARIASNGEVSVRSEDMAWLSEPIKAAHALGLQILIKPHLAYWGSPFSWRGEITFDEPAEWERFFESYTQWIVGVAEATVGADAFAVGTELDKTLSHEAEWRQIISRIETVNGAALTFASNWTDYWRVPFWDALDAIGIQAYFPLSQDERPSEATLRAAWVSRMNELRKFSSDWQKPIVFTELGYSRTWIAAREPWLARTEEQESESLQRLCLRLALEAIEQEPAVVGSFLWKWFPEPRPVGRDFQMAAPGVREELRSVWRSSLDGALED